MGSLQGKAGEGHRAKLPVLKPVSRPAPGSALSATAGIMGSRPEGPSGVPATRHAAPPELSSPCVLRALAQPRRTGTAGAPIPAWVTKGDRQTEPGGLLQ